ncbi:hypothetical protein [Paenibacillus tianmuensis]|uniref:hypothetical protein n=1 Tax=Paenibacillus tianmuensis TaxID=624147 RepID=UPI003CCC1080
MPPQQIQAQEFHRLFLAVHRHGSSSKLGRAIVEQLDQLHHLAFFRWTAPSLFSNGGTLIGYGIGFDLRDDVQTSGSRLIPHTQPLQSGNGQKVAIQQEQRAPERLGGRESLIDHLHDMGRLPILGLLIPAEDCFYTVLQVYGQGQAEALLRRSGQNSDGAKQMAKDVLALGRVFGFLMELLDARHPATFLGLLHPIADEYDTLLHVQERSRAANHMNPSQRSDSSDQAEERKKWIRVS